VSSIEDIASRARGAGINVALLETPLHPGIRGLFPGPIQTFKDELSVLALHLNMEVMDFTGTVPDDPTLWVDALHLNRTGAEYFGPQLASALKPILGS
jgi:hypothetical protein